MFTEAGQAVVAMPFLMFQPILTFICYGIATWCWMYFTLWILSAGIKTEVYENFYVYKRTFLINLTNPYNVFIFLWMLLFISGCHTMVAAGAISEWYFTRNKSKLDSPIIHGFSNLLRYHMGSVSFGSLTITIVAFIRELCSACLGGDTGACGGCGQCVECGMCAGQAALEYISLNAYIEIAIHGEPFCESGKRAVEVLGKNALRTVAIVSIGVCVICVAQLLVMIVIIVIGLKMILKKPGVHYGSIPVCVAAILSCFISACCFSVYDTAVDSLFICFCEDLEENDGKSKPYFMSPNLLEFVENCKKDASNSRRRNSLVGEQQRTTANTTV